MARHVMERLISGGKVTRGYLGVTLQDLTPVWRNNSICPIKTARSSAMFCPTRPRKRPASNPATSSSPFNGKNVSDANACNWLVSESAPGSVAALN
jgi:serine protease Do